MTRVSLGWVIWDGEGPHRPTHGSGWRQRKAPARIYTTKAKAEAYGGAAVEVFAELPA